MNAIKSLPVYREDGEHVGNIIQISSDEWYPATVFDAALATSMSRDDAETYLENYGLSSLAEKWIFHTGEKQILSHIIEASPTSVTIQFVDSEHPDVAGTTKVLRVPIDGVLDLA